MSDPDAVALTGEDNIVSVGGGARWSEVYHVLDSMNLGTAGGRVADVGVGGLTTGGMCASRVFCETALTKCRW